MLIGSIEKVCAENPETTGADIKIVHTSERTAEVYVNGFKIPSVAAAAIEVFGCNGIDKLTLSINAKNTEIVPFKK